MNEVFLEKTFSNTLKMLFDYLEKKFPEDSEEIEIIYEALNREFKYVIRDLQDQIELATCSEGLPS